VNARNPPIIRNIRAIRDVRNATQFQLTSSRWIATLIVFAYGATAAALLALFNEAIGWTLAALTAALGIATAWDRALLRARRSVRGFEIQGPGRIVLELSDDGRLAVPVGSRRWVSAHLVALPIAAPRRRTLLIAGDMLDPDAFRRLRLWALWGQLPGVAPLPPEPR